MCKDGYDEKLRAYVQAGGTFVTSYFSGIVDNNDLVVTGGYPGRLRDILGIWVEESDAIPKSKSNSFVFGDKRHTATVLCDLLHLTGAESLGNYEQDFYKGMPAVTVNSFGEGKAYYVATRADEEFYYELLWGICRDVGLRPLQKTTVAVEATLRENENGKFLFLLNHGEATETVILAYGGTDLISGQVFNVGENLTLGPKGVAIIQG
jgi:beta-galactosidase